MLSALLHSVVLLTLAVGSGFWFWRLAGRSSLVRGHWWLWCVLAGFAAQTLLAEQALCANLPFVVVAWAAFLVALAGMAGWIRTWWRAQASLRRRWGRQLGAVAVVAAIVGGVQGSSWLARGPEHFHGRARIDQLNYVLLGQYLIDGPPGLTVDRLGLRPWLARAVHMREGRITQCVPQAEVAVVTGADAQRTFGATNTLYVVLAGVAVHALLAAWGVRRRWSALAGVAAGLLPAVTVTHLEGFFSQTAVLWVLPAIAGTLCRHRPKLPAAIGAGAIVGFSVGAYTEYALLPAVAGVVTVRWGAGWRQWWRTAGVVGVTAGLLNALSLPRLAEYLVGQLGQASDPLSLGYLVPGSGTFDGWGREFAGYDFQWASAAGVGVTLLALVSLALAPRPWRVRLPALFIGPLLLALPMVFAAQLPVYPFAKLLRTTAPLTVVALAALALGRTAGWRAALAVGSVGAVTVAGAVMAVTAHREVIAGTPATADADLAVVHASPVLAGEPRRARTTVLIDSELPLVTGWLAYHARRHDVYLLRKDVSDRVLPQEFSACRRWPEGLRDVEVVTRERVEHRDFIPPPPVWSAENGEELRVGPGRSWRAKGTLRFRLDRAKDADLSTPEYRWVCFALRCAKPGATFALRSPGVPRVSRLPASERWAYRAEWSGPTARFSIQGPDADTEFYVVAIGVEPPDLARSPAPPLGFFSIDLDAPPTR